MSGVSELRVERAREILENCRQGLDRLWQNPNGHDWVIQWAGTLALLRTVGDALKNLQKVDANTDPRLRLAQADWWRRTKAGAPPIYCEFIQKERNLLLHGATLNAGQSAMVFLQGVEATALAAGQSPPPPKPIQPLAAAKYSYHMNSGPFAGRDPRELIEEGVAWWERQIAEIERDAAGR
jgi:hypothetical protein